MIRHLSFSPFLLSCFLNFSFELLCVEGSCLFVDNFSVLYDHESGNGLYGILGCEILVVVHVNFSIYEIGVLFG